MAAGHHMEGGQRKQILLDFATTIHHLYEASQCVEKVIVPVAMPAEEKHAGGYSGKKVDVNQINTQESCIAFS